MLSVPAADRRTARIVILLRHVVVFQNFGRAGDAICLLPISVDWEAGLGCLPRPNNACGDLVAEAFRCRGTGYDDGPSLKLRG